MAVASETPAVKVFKNKVMDATLFNIGPLAITGSTLLGSLIVTRVARDIYISDKYTKREKKYGVKWEYKDDKTHCVVCKAKFATIGMRKEQQKHHCRM